MVVDPVARDEGRPGSTWRTLVGSKGPDADGVLPAAAQWKAHNYNHLMEQPTLFYAICAGDRAGRTATGRSTPRSPGPMSACGSLHSIVQATVNRVLAALLAVRCCRALCLVALTLHAAMAVF